MGYKPWPRHAFEDTSRKRAAFRRKQKRERDALPLFAEQIAATQHSEDEEMHRRAVSSAAQELRDRNARAREWREARRWLDAMPRRTRRALRVAWDCAPYPADPSRLLGILRDYEMGKIDLNALSFPLTKTDAGGARVLDSFETDSDWLFISILQCRDIAEYPDAYSIADRCAAYHHLQKAADCNKDRDRAWQDRVLAADLWPRLGELNGAVRR